MTIPEQGVMVDFRLWRTARPHNRCSGLVRIVQRWRAGSETPDLVLTSSVCRVRLLPPPVALPLTPTQSKVPESYEIDQVRGLVISRGWKTVSDRELRSHYERLEHDRKFDPSFRQLIDLRDVERFALTSEVMLGAALAHVFRCGVPRAIIVRNEEQESLARRFAAYSEADGQNVQIFREPAGAKEWLGVS